MLRPASEIEYPASEEARGRAERIRVAEKDAEIIADFLSATEYLRTGVGTGDPDTTPRPKDDILADLVEVMKISRRERDE